MRRSFSLCLMFAVCSLTVTAGVRTASADPVTVRVSEVASGTFGGYDFTNKLVTLEAHFTTEEYQSCVATGYVDGNPCDPNYFYAPDGTTATVEGLGTAAAGGPAGGDPGVYVLPGRLGVADFANDLGIILQLPAFTGDITTSFGPQVGQVANGTSQDACVDDHIPCPGYFGLEGRGDLYFDSVGTTGTAEIIVGSPVPEPGTWVMVGTGLVGGLGAVRRRLGR